MFFYQLSFAHFFLSQLSHTPALRQSYGGSSDSNSSGNGDYRHIKCLGRRSFLLDQRSCGSKRVRQTHCFFFFFFLFLSSSSMAPELGIDVGLHGRTVERRSREPESTRKIMGSGQLRKVNSELYKCGSNPNQHIPKIHTQHRSK